MLAIYTKRPSSTINKGMCAAKELFTGQKGAKLRGRLNRAGIAHAQVHHLDDFILEQLLEDLQAAIAEATGDDKQSCLEAETVFDHGSFRGSGSGSDEVSPCFSEKPFHPSQMSPPVFAQQCQQYIIRTEAIHDTAVALRALKGAIVTDQVINNVAGILEGLTWFAPTFMPASFGVQERAHIPRATEPEFEPAMQEPFIAKLHPPDTFLSEGTHRGTSGEARVRCREGRGLSMSIPHWMNMVSWRCWARVSIWVWWVAS